MTNATYLSGPRKRGKEPAEAGKRSEGSWRPLAISAILLVGIQFVMYHLFPGLTKWFEFHVIMRHFWHVLPWGALLGWLLYDRRVINRFLRGRQVENIARHLTVVITLFVLVLIWSALLNTATNMVTYRMYASSFSAQDEMMPSSTDFVRFTPLENACHDLGNSVQLTGQHVECNLVQPIITDHGFGYVAPVTPSGLYNTFLGKNPGFLVLDDSAWAAEDPTKRIRRIDDPQMIGQGMEWFDGADYKLAKTDFFASFDTPHFLALDPDKPDEFTLAVPKIKYRFFLFPYWGGTALIHSDGTIEDLSTEEVRADKRFAGKWVFPNSLAKHYVELQNYAAGHGVLTPFIRLAGLFEIEKLPTDNQFPFLTQGIDGQPYLVTATKGQGSAKGLFRMYYVNAATGVGSYHEFDSHEVVYGPGATLGRVYNVEGYMWKDAQGGKMIVVEPVYIVRPSDGKLYWKFTITNENNQGVSATAVADAAIPGHLEVFKRRADYEAWLGGATAVVRETGDKAEILQTISDLAEMLDDLRQQVDAMPE